MLVYGIFVLWLFLWVFFMILGFWVGFKFWDLCFFWLGSCVVRLVRRKKREEKLFFGIFLRRGFLSGYRLEVFGVLGCGWFLRVMLWVLMIFFVIGFLSSVFYWSLWSWLVWFLF